MKKFIIKTLLFLSVPILVIVILIYIPYSKISYQLEEEVEFVFIGDSHIQVAIMPDIFPASKSYGISSEPTFFSYYKIKKIIELNPHVKKVYIGFSYHNISSYYDDYIWGKDSKVTLPRYLDLLPSIEKIWLIAANKNNFQTFFNEYLTLKHSGLVQGYNNPFENTVAVEKSMLKRIKRQFVDADGNLNSISEVNIASLKKMKDLTSQKGVELILLNIPVHPFYLNLVPNKFKDAFDNRLKALELVPVDFSNLVLNDSCFTPDGDHLSQKGAKLLTTYLKNN